MYGPKYLDVTFAMPGVMVRHEYAVRVYSLAYIACTYNGTEEHRQQALKLAGEPGHFLPPVQPPDSQSETWGTQLQFFENLRTVN